MKRNEILAKEQQKIQKQEYKKNSPFDKVKKDRVR